MQEILEMIAKYGLPIVLTVWFVFRINPTITKLVNLLESFIEWQTEKETERKEKDKELRDTVKSMNEQCSKIMSKLDVMEVKIDR